MTDGPIETPGPEGTEDLSGPTQDELTTELTTEPSGHPAWQPILDALPDDALRSMVTPHLQQWDQGVQERFQQLHQQYEPWKPVIEGANPQLVQQALALVQKIEDDPEFVWNALAESYGLGKPAETPGATTEPEPVIFGEGEFDPNDPLVRKISDLEGIIQGFVQSQQQTQQQQLEQQQVAAYNAHMESLKAKYPGPYDEDVIDAMVGNGVDPEAAIQRYQASVKQAAQQILKPSTEAPAVMGGSAGGSGLPTQQVDPATLSSQDSKKLAEAVVKRMMGQG